MRGFHSKCPRTVKALKCSLFAVFVFLAITGNTLAADPVNTGYFGRVAIQGYDTVAYFTEGRPLKGSEEHSVKWLGAYWYFASDSNKDLFVSDPQSYAPQYGGYCATGLAISGELTRDIDPEAWAIIDNKLYLNYSKETNSLLTNHVINLEKADENWAKIGLENN